ncbi:hypothetical protein SLOPH_2589 [Spraguea lophii 42_110]|uniref:Uncharacterized protein n=1 Tax=Spraguea lophii (strain 42_110) TaxID=1358809 RepID=S7XVM0_SPRLO|nr:hypothetical protein SLOPH_2589 [Spraguea lophii 42_110]
MKIIGVFVLFLPFMFSALPKTENYFVERINLLTTNNSLNNLIEIMMNISYSVENDDLNDYDKNTLKTIKDKLANTMANYGPGVISTFGSLLRMEYKVFLSSQDHNDLRKIVTFLSDKLLKKVSNFKSLDFVKEEVNVKNTLLGYRLLHKINYIYENLENLKNNKVVEVYHNTVCSYTRMQNANRAMKVYTCIFVALISLIFAAITIKYVRKK